MFNRNKLTMFTALFLLVSLLPEQSKASLIRAFLKFSSEVDINYPKQMPPSPSPVPSIGFNSSAENFDEPIETDERCKKSLSKECHNLKNITACLSSGPQGSFVIVQNDEENSVTVNLSISPQKLISKAIVLEKHQAKQINIPGNGVIQLIVLNAGNGDCKIPMESPPPEYDFGLPTPVANYLNPMHGAYLLVLIVLITGGACACFKLRKRGRHLDGVPYQELEMGQPDESLPVVNMETSEGWDQDWDDDWDEEKAVKLPEERYLGNGHANGLASRPSKGDGWGNDWDE